METPSSFLRPAGGSAPPLCARPQRAARWLGEAPYPIHVMCGSVALHKERERGAGREKVLAGAGCRVLGVLRGPSVSR